MKKLKFKNKDDVNSLTRKQLDNLPKRQWNVVSIYDMLWIVPTNKKHDSGFTIMNLVGYNRNNQSAEIAASPDDIDFDISNIVYGEHRNGHIRIDCLYPSKIIQVWSNQYKFKVKSALSSTDIELMRIV